MTPAILVDAVSKRYALGTRSPSYGTLRESIMASLATSLNALRGRRTARVRQEYIWALDDVSFEVMPGEVVGVIGRNGTGKSTLLKILARITAPTSGRALLRGRVGSLLDVGTGFHSELTGQENIYLNGAILGMSRAHTRARLEEIVEFAGIGQFLDTPVKHYSDGMRMRLAFSVAAHLDTDILLADEVLAVGDTVFQNKCVMQMGALASSGRTVLFVSHNMTAIGQLCPTTILMDRGRLVAFGKTHDIIGRYFADLCPNTHTAVIEPPSPDRGAAVAQVDVGNPGGKREAVYDWRVPIDIGVAFVVTRSLPGLSVGVTLINQVGIRVLFSWIVFQRPFEPGTYEARGRLCGEMLNPGQYHVTVHAEDGGGDYYHEAPEVVSFEIVDTTGELGLDIEQYGLVYRRIPWDIRHTAKVAPEKAG